MKLKQALQVSMLLSFYVFTTTVAENCYVDTIKSVGQAQDDALEAIENGDYILADSIITELEGMRKRQHITKRIRTQFNDINHGKLLVQTADNLENRLRTTEQNLTRAHGNIKSLEESLSASKQIVAAREATLEQMTAAYKTKQQENSKLMAASRELTANYAKTKQALSDMHQKFESASKHSHNLQQRIAKLESECKENEQRVAVLESEKQSMQETSSFEPTLNKIATTLDEKYNQLMQEKQDYMKRIAALERERSELVASNKSLEQERSNMSQKIVVIEKEDVPHLSATRFRRGLAAQEKQEPEDKITAREREKSELATSNKTFEQERSAMNQKIAEFKKEESCLESPLEAKKESTVETKAPTMTTVVADTNNKVCQAR